MYLKPLRIEQLRRRETRPAVPGRPRRAFPRSLFLRRSFPPPSFPPPSSGSARPDHQLLVACLIVPLEGYLRDLAVREGPLRIDPEPVAGLDPRAGGRRVQPSIGRTTIGGLRVFPVQRPVGVAD